MAFLPLNMKKYNYETVDINISKDEIKNFTIDTQKLVEGEVVAMALYLQGEVPSAIVNLTLRYLGSSIVFKGSTIQDWIPRTGASYLESMKPVHVDAGQMFTLEFSSRSILETDLIGQVVFVIEQHKMC